MKLRTRIKKGLLVVNLPVRILLILPPFICLLIERNNSVEDTDSHVLLVLLASFLLAWTWWSISIVKWKIWAFQDLDEKTAFELYNKSIEGKLIWPRESIFNKTEIWTRKEKWKNLDLGVQQIFSKS